MGWRGGILTAVLEGSGVDLPQDGHVVLCVDDEVVGLQVRKLILERSGYIVLTAHDGPAGLIIFNDESIDAVVLDYAMPGMHGGEVAAKMREIKPHVPILLLSAYMGLPAEVTRLVNVYMTKGEGAPMLLQKLNALFQN
ncbi:MAG TPA: response regulator [Acidobacteriaceae bacterium]|nr:response regulator [Acidobacteriaceae bacterium]